MVKRITPTPVRVPHRLTRRILVSPPRGRPIVGSSKANAMYRMRFGFFRSGGRPVSVYGGMLRAVRARGRINMLEHRIKRMTSNAPSRAAYAARSAAHLQRRAQDMVNPFKRRLLRMRMLKWRFAIERSPARYALSRAKRIKRA